MSSSRGPHIHHSYEPSFAFVDSSLHTLWPTIPSEVVVQSPPRRLLELSNYFYVKHEATKTG